MTFTDIFRWHLCLQQHWLQSCQPPLAMRDAYQRLFMLSQLNSTIHAGLQIQRAVP